MIIRAENLSCVRAGKKIFHGLSFQLCTHSWLWIQGSNGSGKTSLLRILAGLSHPDKGWVYWQDNPISNNFEYKNKVHYLGHFNGGKLDLTVGETFLLYKTMYETSKETCDTAIQSLKLSALWNVSLRCLSAGERRRVALSRLLLQPRSVWILDEPFTSLDTNMHIQVQQMVDQHIEEGGLVMASSHQIPLSYHYPPQILRLPVC